MEDLDISTLVRDVLIDDYDISEKDAEDFAELLNEKLSEIDWISTYRGSTFELPESDPDESYGYQLPGFIRDLFIEHFINFPDPEFDYEDALELSEIIDAEMEKSNSIYTWDDLRFELTFVPSGRD